MHPYQPHLAAVATLSVGLLLAAPAASQTMVSRSTWGATGVPDYVNMYIQVPNNPPANPPILVACHSCGTPVEGYVNSITRIRAAVDQTGFVLILPEATNRNCWDVGSSASLTHDGGGDTQAIAQMVQYALTTYNGDPDRVYIMGGSSGAMMTQAMLAVYPDLFKAGSARAGVPAGCWADGYDPGQQWSGNCANGTTNKSAQEWGDLVRGMHSSFTGPRPRVQLFHGEADTTIRYPNMGEAIEEWTNVLGLSSTPDSTDSTTTSVATYNRQFWTDECGATALETWSAPGQGHSMAYEEESILAFFGLEAAGTPDPQAEACASNSGAGGTTGSTNGSMGAGGSMGGAAGTVAGATGAFGGSSGTGGASGNTSAMGTSGGTMGGSTSSGVTVGMVATATVGGTGMTGAGGAQGAGTLTNISSGTTGTSGPESGTGDDGTESGCSCIAAGSRGGSLPSPLSLLLAGFGLLFGARRWRSA